MIIESIIIITKLRFMSNLPFLIPKEKLSQNRVANKTHKHTKICIKKFLKKIIDR